MATLDFMQKRLERLQQARVSLEEGKIILDMREKDNEDVTVDRQKLSDSIEANELAQKNTREAIAELQALHDTLTTE